MEEQPPMAAPASLTSAQQALADLWDQHLRAEFVEHNAEEAVDTMVEDATVNHVPVLTGGVGRQQLHAFYSNTFIPQIPPDQQITPISRTIGTDRLVDEFVATFTHTIQMDWLLPGVPPTGKSVEVPVVVLVQFREGKMASETLYWDQASVLVQLGLLHAETLPVSGVESTRKVLDPTLPSNALIERAKASKRQ
jgi:carboxymethylenebutenolidase